MNERIIEAINLNYNNFAEVILYKNYEDIKINNSKELYKYNNETHIWQKIMDKSKMLLLIKDVINDFNKLNGIIDNKKIQEIKSHYDKLKNWKKILKQIKNIIMMQKIYITKIIDKDDNIFAFNNGYLYDSNIKSIREIKKQDNITFTCNYPYNKEITKQE